MSLYYFLSRTMLVERLLGVGVYAVLLLFMYLGIKGSRDYRALSRTLNVYILLLCVMAFFYVPGDEADLYRWRDIIDQYFESMSFSEFAETYLFQVTTPVAYLMFYLCGKSGIEGLLPFICALVFYSNAFYILKDLYRRHQVTVRGISIAMVFLMAGGGFLEVISGVRCFVSLSILARCFYNEMYNDKPIWKNIVWVLLASLIHSMAALLLIGRFLFSLVQKKRRPAEKILNIILTAGLVLLVVSFGGSYLQGALDKAGAYASGGGDDYAFFWEYLIGAFVFLQSVIILFRAQGTVKRSTVQHGMRNLLGFNLALLAVELVLAYEYNMFHRMIMFSTLMMTPVAAVAADDTRNQGLDYIILLSSLVVLVIAGARGNLSGYKFLMPY